MIEGDLQLLVRLLAIPGIGQQTLRELRDWCSKRRCSVRNWWETGKSAPVFSHKQWSSIQAVRSHLDIDAYWQHLQAQAISVIADDDSTYPSLLLQVSDRPLILFVTGRPLEPMMVPIAVVGTRKLTGYGRLVTHKIVSELVNLGATIISGGMYGVDMTAHQAALAAGGHTVAVLGFGFGHWYPAIHIRDREQLLAQGATLVSEYPPGTLPTIGTFPQRNRLIAGMSQAVVVTEAGLHSGSHITARLGTEYGREVMAVPGPITNPYCEGTKWLINQGATLVSSGQEVMDELPVFGDEVSLNVRNEAGTKLKNSDQSMLRRRANQTDPLAKLILQALESQTLSTDELITVTHSQLSDLVAHLTELELKGMVTRSGDSWQLQ